ncbi:hypothetical protein B0H14DRAFT_2563642 [Mycena olivaceomarginata]|nr:hypothetical protein B0H14DRAFT_2563642 [Mycena olivaceomarginata]
MAGVVVPSCGSGKDHGTTINGKLWPFPFANWECPHDHACLPYICMWDVPIGSGPSLETLAVFLLFSGTTYSRTCLVIWKSVESCKPMFSTKAERFVGYLPGNVRATSAQVPIYAGRLVLGAGFTDHGGIKISSYRWTDGMNQSGSQGMIVRIKLCASLYCTSIPKVGAWMRYNTPCTARYQAWTGPPIRTAGWYPRMIVRIKLCASLYCTLIPKQDIRPGLGPPFVLRDGAQTQTICKAAKACKGFQIHPFAAQYMQKCTQYCNFFGPCDVTPWEIPHQKWEAQMDNMGSPDMHTWASHTVPTPAVVLPSHMWELQPNLTPIGPIMYWKQLGPMGLGKGLTEVVP